MADAELPAVSLEALPDVPLEALLFADVLLLVLVPASPFSKVGDVADVPTSAGPSPPPQATKVMVSAL